MAVAIAIASSVANLSLPQGVIVVGESAWRRGRNDAGVPRRVAEAARRASPGDRPRGPRPAVRHDSAMKVIEVEGRARGP